MGRRRTVVLPRLAGIAPEALQGEAVCHWSLSPACQSELLAQSPASLLERRAVQLLMLQLKQRALFPVLAVAKTWAV